MKSGENNLKYTEASFSSWVTERRDGIRVASVSIVFPVPELEEAPPAILTADELMDVINRLQSLHAALATD